jgi:hypothetical protein
MFKTVVYDDGRRSEVIEEFTDEKELVVVRKAMSAVNYLHKCGKKALGRFTFTLTKEGV